VLGLSISAFDPKADISEASQHVYFKRYDAAPKCGGEHESREFIRNQAGWPTVSIWLPARGVSMMALSVTSADF
jgi:hypothetical protein